MSSPSFDEINRAAVKRHVESCKPKPVKKVAPKKPAKKEESKEAE